MKKGPLSREQKNTNHLAIACVKEVDEYNTKHQKIDRSHSRVDISQAMRKIEEMHEKSVQRYRCMSQL